MHRRIRVAHLITNFMIGGAQDYLLSVVRELDQERFEPLIAGRLEGEWVDKVCSIPGVRVFDIPSLRRDISPWNDFRAIFQIRKFCQEHDIDILHTHSSKPGVVGRFGGTLASVPRIVHTIHGFSFHGFMPAWKRMLFVTIERMMSRYTSVLLLYSHQDHKLATRLGIGAKKSVETFYYGIDYNPFSEQIDRKRIRTSLGFNDSDLVVGFTGRLTEQKGLHILIAAFALAHRQIPSLRLLLVGDGHLQDDLQSMANRMDIKDRVVFTGFRSDIAPLLISMDMFIMTSLWEGLSRSLAEAMYASLPIIATDVGGTSDAIRNNETGWLIPPDDVQSATVALLEVIRNPVKATELAGNGHRWARKNFDPQLMGDRISQLYETLFYEDFQLKATH